MTYKLEIYGNSGLITTLHYSLRPQRFHCTEQIEENDGSYGYLICHNSGREVERKHIRCPNLRR